MATKNTRRKAVSRWLKRAFVLVVGIVFVGVIVGAWLPKPLPIELAHTVLGPLEITVDEDGRTRVKERYLVSAPLGGTLARIQLRPGDRVEQGQLLTRIVPLASPLLDSRSRGTADARVAMALAAQRQAHAHIDRVRASLEFAHTESERQRRLAKEGAIAKAALERTELEERTLTAELTSTEFRAKVADYELDMAQAAKGRVVGTSKGEELDIPSPITGRVLRVLQTSEGAVQPGTPLLELGDPSRLEVVVDILTSDAVRIPIGAPARLDRWGGKTLTGVVRLVEPSAFTRISSLGVEEQRVNAIIDLQSPSSEWAPLGDGYRVEAHIVVWRNPSVLKIPASAFFRHGEGWAVYAVRNGVARRSQVELGQRSGLEVQVLKGLETGEAIVNRPNDQMHDGIPVKAQ